MFFGDVGPADFQLIRLRKYLSGLKKFRVQIDSLEKKVYKSIQKWTKVYKSGQKYTKVDKSTQKWTDISPQNIFE